MYCTRISHDLVHGRFPDARHKGNFPKRELSHLSYTNKCFPRGTVFLENLKGGAVTPEMTTRGCLQSGRLTEWSSN